MCVIVINRISAWLIVIARVTNKKSKENQRLKEEIHKAMHLGE